MTMKCRYNKEMTCEILNKKLGDCEICDGLNGEVQWRCNDYVDEEVQEEQSSGETK